jgi:energy-coupling factor transporter ATP-binding protein EcfA2
MIRVADLTYTYPANESPALDGVSLHIERGSFVAVAGANAAGKSTLCYALSGFVPHFYHGTLNGSVSVAGIDVPKSSLADLAGRVGLVFQDPFNQITGARFTIREEVGFGLENLGVPPDEMEERVRAALELVGLDGMSDRSPYAISGGQQQRLAIASVMVMRPDVLVLDEPTSQLDPAGTRELFEALARLAGEQSTTIVIAEHKLEWIGAYADRVIVLDGGRIEADGAPREILTSRREGLARTRYTRAAAAAAERGMVSTDRELPVTLEQAVEYFS